MKKYIFFIVWLILAAGLAFVAFSSEDSAAILAEVEPRSYAVSFEKNVRIKELYVVPGEQILKGDPLIRVERPDLLIEKENKQNKLTLLKANLNKRELQKENKLYLNDLEYDLKIKQLENKIQEIKASLDQQQRIQEDFKKLDWQKQVTPDSMLLSKLQLLEGEKKLLNREYQLKRKEINSNYALEEANASAEIDLLEKEIQLLETEEMELTQYARVNGTIGSIHVETDQLVPAYTNLLSVYENNPTIIRAFTNEHNEIELESGSVVYIESTNRQYRIKGTVIEVGSRIIQYPERLRTFDQMPSWGREIFIEIPEESKFLNGEKVFVILQP
ncbi:HlyD family secretion protein [Marinoscillum sp.]|uniref:HlyD family secretion protein n=1 Tax=Marinoscillum sp. TaxID=2024838 RepID=UPI003BA97D89